jgi:transcriptional regulator with XRE-family HTH domain
MTVNESNIGLQKKILKEIENTALMKGISMKDLCRKAGLDYTTYWRWTTGKSATVSKLEHLVHILKTL